MSNIESRWTEANVELLKTLWKEGLSCGLIASRIGGVTRNAVIGKVHRIGLARRLSGSPRTPTTRKPRDKKPARDLIVTVRAPKEQPAWKSIPMPAERPRPSTLYTLMDRPDDGCMFFYGDPVKENRGYCGQQRVPGNPYCPECARICFDIRQPNERARARHEQREPGANFDRFTNRRNKEFA